MHVYHSNRPAAGNKTGQVSFFQKSIAQRVPRLVKMRLTCTRKINVGISPETRRQECDSSRLGIRPRSGSSGARGAAKSAYPGTSIRHLLLTNMDCTPFQKLTSTELQRYISELELAVESHARWLNRLNRVFVCHTGADQADLETAPHTACQFGRWYHSIDNRELLETSVFGAIGKIHEQVHGIARRLLLKDSQGKRISVEEYDTLIALSEELRGKIRELNNSLKNDLHIMSKLMGKVFENAAEGVIITAPDGEILSVNKAFSKMTGYEVHEAIGQTPHILQSGRQDKPFYRRMWQDLLTKGQWQGEIWNRRKDGDDYLEWLSIVAVKDDLGETSNYVAIFSDITTEKKNEEKLYHLAHYDSLTGLPNRMLFHDRLRQALARARRNNEIVAVMFLDLDGFKEVNDELGHNAGDKLLTHVAQRLTQCLRESDTVGRFGGDEFTVVLPQAQSRKVIGTVAGKIIEAVNQPYTLGDRDLNITTSLGISIYPIDAGTPARLIKNADMAMYHAKKAGKNRFFYYSPRMA